MLKKFIKHRLVQDTLVLFGVQISAYLLPLVTLPYLTRILGPANFGLLALGSAMVLYFMVITEYGFAVTGTRRVAIVQDDPAQVARVYSSIMACKLCLMGFSFLVLVGIVAATPKLQVHWQLYLVSFLLVLGYCLSPNWLFQGLQRMKFVAYSDYGAKLISVGLIFLLIRKSSDYLLAAAVQTGGFFLSACIGLCLVFFVIRLRPVRPCWKDMREMMLEGWPVFLSMASMTVTTSSNTVILGMVTTPDQVGFLSAASRLIIAARALTNPVTNAVYPHMSQLAAKSREKGLQLLERQLIWTCAPFLLVSLGMLLFAPLVVRILYGPKYVETGVLLRLMCLTPFVHSIGMCFGNYYMLAFGYEKEWSRIIRRMMVLNFISVFALMALMRPVRAIAVTITLMDIFTAGSCVLFYRRTAGKSREDTAAAVEQA
ncbi:MAG TPA: flippase [Bryobacteraceae bacterium]|nr:flippase [Bryobacteraceae bacterium]